MVIDTATVSTLTSVLDTASRRKLFDTIANSRIAPEKDLEAARPGEDLSADLGVLEAADLIGAGKDRKRFYVTAKGLKIARDLGKL